MNSSDLQKICGEYDSKIKPYFCGVFAIDVFESYYSRYCKEDSMNIFVVNTQPSDLPGEHWVLISLNKKNLFFDSFHKSPRFYGLLSPKMQECTSYRLQGDSRICGVYCIWAARLLSQNKDIHSIIDNYFSKTDLKANDCSVIQWLKSQPYGKVVSFDCKNDCLAYKDFLKW